MLPEQNSSRHHGIDYVSVEFFAAVVFMCSSGCIVVGPGSIHGNGAYVFDLDMKGRSAASQPVPEFVVLTEHIRDHELPKRREFVEIAMHLQSESRASIKLPAMTNPFVIALWVSKAGTFNLTDRTLDYVDVTFFVPGWRVMQVLPEGPWGGPVPSRKLPAAGGGRDFADGPLANCGVFSVTGQLLDHLLFEKGHLGEVICSVPIGSLPPSDVPKSFCNSECPCELNNCCYEFRSIIDRVTEEIRLGLLDDVEVQPRRVLYETVSRQAQDPMFSKALEPHDYWVAGKTIKENEGLRPIAAWAGIDTRASADRPEAGQALSNDRGSNWLFAQTRPRHCGP